MNPRLTIAIAVIFGGRFVRTIPPGHVGVAALFCEVRPVPDDEGFHFPVNPLYEWLLFDTRQKTAKESIQVLTHDPLRTKVDLSVQWRIIGEMAPAKGR